MAMNSNVAAGRIDQTTSSVWLPCVYCTGSAFFAASYFHMNQNNARLVMMKITPVRYMMNRNRLSITWPEGLIFCGSQCPCMGHQPFIAQTKTPTPRIGTSRNSKLQKRPTGGSNALLLVKHLVPKLGLG